MKKTRFTEEQMVTILREADRRPVPEVAKQRGVSAQTIYSWRKHFTQESPHDGRPQWTLEPADVKRLRELEQENGRLKKLVADRDLEIDVLKEITRKKWWAHRRAGSRSRTLGDAGCRAATRAPCYQSLDRHWATRLGYSSAMPRWWRSCVSLLASIHDTATGRSGSSSRGEDTP